MNQIETLEIQCWLTCSPIDVFPWSINWNEPYRNIHLLRWPLKGFSNLRLQNILFLFFFQLSVYEVGNYWKYLKCTDQDIESWKSWRLNIWSIERSAGNEIHNLMFTWIHSLYLYFRWDCKSNVISFPSNPKFCSEYSKQVRVVSSNKMIENVCVCLISQFSMFIPPQWITMVNKMGWICKSFGKSKARAQCPSQSIWINISNLTALWRNQINIRGEHTRELSMKYFCEVITILNCERDYPWDDLLEWQSICLSIQFITIK